MDVAVAQMNAIKGFSRQAQMLPLSEGWAKYEVHPERATPHTVSEQLSYKRTYEDFVAFVTTPGKHHTVINTIAELNSDIAEEFANFMRTLPQAVDTHNRKIKRLRKIFDCLKDYYSGANPFNSKTLLRNVREEQNTVVRRQAFSKEQEQQLREVLADERYTVMNKPEIRVIYYIGMFTGQRLKDCVLLLRAPAHPGSAAAQVSSVPSERKCKHTASPTRGSAPACGQTRASSRPDREKAPHHRNPAAPAPAAVAKVQTTP